MSPRPRAVGYVRVSTDRQADAGFGLDVQTDAIRAWAADEGVTVRHWTRDEGRSGADEAIARPGLAEALGLVHVGRAELLVVARLDRLARRLVLQEQLRAEVIRAGGSLRSTVPVEDLHLREDPSDPTGRLVRHILGAIAEYERDVVRLRMEAGKAAKRAAGGYVGGAPPFGWQAIGGQLVPHAAEQETLRRMRRLQRAGHSYRSIAVELNRAGLGAKRGRWHPLTVAQVLRHSARRPA